MTCVSEGSLRAYCDGELASAERAEVQRHLAGCPGCTERADQQKRLSDRVQAQLLVLGAPGEGVDARAALARVKRQLDGSPEQSRVRGGLFRRRPVWVAGLGLALVALSLSFPPGRSLAQRFLETLRVEKVQPVSLDTSALEANRGLQQAIQHLISDQMIVTVDEKEQSARDATEAGRLAGFAVSLPGSRPDAPRLTVQGQHSFHMTLDRGRLQEIFNQAGRPDLTPPESVDGATVAVQIPRSLQAQYGSCPEPGGAAEKQRREGEFRDCLFLLEAPSPIVSVPPGLDVQQLAEIGLEITGMNPAQAKEFCRTVDWKSTLVLPLPHHLRSYQVVDVNGVPGTLVSNPNAQGPRYALIWVKGGIIYSLIGYGDSGEALTLANSLT